MQCFWHDNPHRKEGEVRLERTEHAHPTDACHNDTVRRISGGKGEVLTAWKGGKKCWELGTRLLQQIRVCAAEALEERIAGGFKQVCSQSRTIRLLPSARTELTHSTLESNSKYSTQHRLSTQGAMQYRAKPVHSYQSTYCKLQYCDTVQHTLAGRVVVTFHTNIHDSMHETQTCNHRLP